MSSRIRTSDGSVSSGDASLVWASATRAGGTAPEPNDDRTLVYADLALFAVVDARGTSYGGYSDPVAVDAALSLFARMAGEETQAGAPRILAATNAAEKLLRELAASYSERVERERKRWWRAGDRAPFRAAASIARERFGREVSGLLTFQAALTALAFTPGEVAVAQNGHTRAYRARDGVVEQLVPDHTLGSVDPTAPTEHAHVPAQLLGSPKATAHASLPTRAGDVYLLCTDGVWKSLTAPLEARLFAAPATEIMRALVTDTAEEDDATALVIRLAGTSANRSRDP
jgi:serine/threonine protein phosphatase PrpC